MPFGVIKPERAHAAEKLLYLISLILQQVGHCEQQADRSQSPTAEQTGQHSSDSGVNR